MYSPVGDIIKKQTNIELQLVVDSLREKEHGSQGKLKRKSSTSAWRVKESFSKEVIIRLRPE